jgi:PadR family transcriptional regulator PadR
MSNPQKNVQTKLTKGLLDLIILELLGDHPMHGYQIITTIRKSFGVYFGPSTIYPLLATMEKKNYVKCEWNMDSERPRKVYSLTINGKAMLEYTTGSLRAICKTIGTNNLPLDGEKHMQLNVAFNSKKNSPHSISG